MLASEQKTYTGTAYNTYTFAYSYALDGSLASQTYPSGRIVDFTYDGSGRPNTVQEAGGGDSYLNSVAYAAHGGIDNMQLGNLLVEQTCYNDLLQPIARRLGDATSSGCAVQPSTDLLHLDFGYGAAATNHGNMMQQTVWAPDNGSGAAWQVTQDYTYDQVNRLATAEEKLGGVPQWSRTYDYDHFGNRWISGATGHTLHMATPTSSAAIQATTNRLTGTGITYDNAGNLTAHPHITPSGSMTYDANNKMTAFAATGVSVSTAYDAADRRVRKVHNSKTTVWIYDAFGKLAAEYTTEAHADTETYFRTTDHLGSTRLTTDEVGDVVARRDFFPFGERIDATLSGRGSVVDGTLVSFNSSPGMRQQFTGQQRDDETGLDYFWARYMSPPVARFASIDPGMAGAKLAFPQTWNAYSYVRNNPLRYTDPTGMTEEDGDPTDSEGFCEDPSNEQAEICGGGGGPELEACSADFCATGVSSGEAAQPVGPAPVIVPTAVMSPLPVRLPWPAPFPTHTGMDSNPGPILDVISVIVSGGAAAVASTLFRSLSFKKAAQLSAKVAIRSRASPKDMKFAHIFDAKHGLDPLVRQFGGREATFDAVGEAAVRHLNSLSPDDFSGLVNQNGVVGGIVIDVGGHNINVTGAIINDVFNIGDFWVVP